MTVRQGFIAEATVAAGIDLSDTQRGTGDIFKAVDASSGLIAATSILADGIITQPGELGVGVTYAYVGEIPFTAGAAIVANAHLKVATGGYIVTADSGDYVVGKNVKSAVASGEVGAALFNFINPYYLSV